MTTIKVPLSVSFSQTHINELKQNNAVTDIQLADNQLHVTISSDDTAVISQVLSKINEFDQELVFSLGDFPVEKLSCDGCASGAERLLNHQPGVVTASVKFQTKSAKIYYLQNKTTPLKLKVALEQLGYNMAL